jgi:hypothetical protein
MGQRHGYMPGYSQGAFIRAWQKAKLERIRVLAPPVTAVSPARKYHAQPSVKCCLLPAVVRQRRLHRPSGRPGAATAVLRPGQECPGPGRFRPLRALRADAGGLPTDTLPGLRRTHRTAEDRRQCRGRALFLRAWRPAASQLDEAALVARAGRSRRLADVRQVLRPQAEVHRTRLPVRSISAEPRSARGGLRHRREALVVRQGPARGLRPVVRALGQRGPTDRAEALAAGQTGGPGAQLFTGRHSGQRPRQPRAPGPAVAGSGAKAPGPGPERALPAGRRGDVRRGQPRAAAAGQAGPRAGHATARRLCRGDALFQR